MNNLTYVIANMTEVNNVDYSQVEQTSSQTVRKSLDGSKFILKYNESIPSTILSLDAGGKLFTYDGKKYFTHPEILEIISTPEWTGTQSLIP